MNQVKYIVRKRAMGDVLWTEPVIRALAPQYRKLVVYTKHPVLFENFPFSNVVFKQDSSFPEKVLVGLEKKFGSGLLTVNLDDAYEKRPSLHFLHAYQQQAKLGLTNEYPRLYLSSKEKESRLVPGKFVVLHIESFADKKYRQVYGIDWTTVVRFFTDRGLKVVQVGINQQPVEGTMPLKTSIRELISLLYHANFFVGIDSGPSHLAASLGIPSLLLFGAINPKLRHFPELFNGILLKQPCNNDCTTYDVASAYAHHCSALLPGDIPRCCMFATDNVILHLQQLLKNAGKVIQ